MKSLAAADRHGLAAVRGPPGVLLAGRPGLRVGADAARARPGGRRRGLEPARVGPADREDAPRPAAPGGHPAALPGQPTRRGPPVADEYVYRVVDALDAVAAETGKTVPQVALNWLLGRPTVSTVIIGARDEGSCGTTSGRSGGPSRPTGRPGWTRPAPSPCRTRTGTSGASPSGTRPRSPDPTGPPRLSTRRLCEVTGVAGASPGAVIDRVQSRNQEQVDGGGAVGRPRRAMAFRRSRHGAAVARDPAPLPPQDSRQ